MDLRFAALTVRDDDAPTFTADGVPRVACGSFDVAVDARDSGIGVARATAMLGGRVVAIARPATAAAPSSRPRTRPTTCRWPRTARPATA